MYESARAMLTIANRRAVDIRSRFLSVTTVAVTRFQPISENSYQNLAMLVCSGVRVLFSFEPFSFTSLKSVVYIALLMAGMTGMRNWLGDSSAKVGNVAQKGA